MKPLRFASLTGTAMALFVGLAHAQVGPATLTVEDAVSRALANSHRLAEIRARQDAAAATTRIRESATQPTVAATAGYSRTNHVDEFGVPTPGGMLRVIYPDIPDNYFTRLSFQWPIYTAGRSDALIRAAEAEARAVGADLEAARADLRLETVRAFWAAATAREAAVVLEEALDRAEAHLRDVRSRFDAGLIPPNEVSLVEAQRSRQLMQLIEARSLRDSVTEELRRLTGIPRDVEIDFGGPGLEPGPSTGIRTGPEGPGFPGLSERAATRVEGSPGIAHPPPDRAEHQALAERITAVEDRQRAAAAGRRPSFAFTGSFDYANPNPRIFPRVDDWRRSWDLTVTVNWPLWDGGRTRAETAEAAAAATALRERLAEVDSLIALDIRQRQLELQSANAALDAAEAAVRSAQEARRVVGERFTVGVATSTEVLDAQVALLQAELDRTRARANIRLAEARLERALGR